MNIGRIYRQNTKKEPLPTPEKGIDRGSLFVFRAFKQVPKSTLISALKKKLRREDVYKRQSLSRMNKSAQAFFFVMRSMNLKYILNFWSIVLKI